jgi:hypothetical protein
LGYRSWTKGQSLYMLLIRCIWFCFDLFIEFQTVVNVLGWKEEEKKKYKLGRTRYLYMKQSLKKLLILVF